LHVEEVDFAQVDLCKRWKFGAEVCERADKLDSGTKWEKDEREGADSKWGKKWPFDSIASPMHAY
jgi:hypothetical protein